MYVLWFLLNNVKMCIFNKLTRIGRFCFEVPVLQDTALVRFLDNVLRKTSLRSHVRLTN